MSHISSVATILGLSFLLAACSSGRASDGDLVRLCRLNARCTGIDETTCQSSVAGARDTANRQGCGSQFGAAARCTTSADECTVPPECFDENERLQACQGASPTDSGPARDGGVFVPLDTGPLSPSDLRQGAMGALEIYHLGEWRPICDDGFDMTEATVACRHLGFSGATGFSAVTGLTDTFWLDDVVCTGGESFLDQCTHSGWGSDNCSASETQAVTCF